MKHVGILLIGTAILMAMQAFLGLSLGAWVNASNPFTWRLAMALAGILVLVVFGIGVVAHNRIALQFSIIPIAMCWPWYWHRFTAALFTLREGYLAYALFFLVPDLLLFVSTLFAVFFIPIQFIHSRVQAHQ